MIYLVHIVILSVLVYLFTRSLATIDKKLFVGLAILKMGVGLLMGIIYMNFYGSGDTLVFFDQTTIFNENIKGNYLKGLFLETVPGLADQPRTRFFVKLISPIVLLTKNYWLTSFYLSIFSAVCSWSLCKNLIKHLRIPAKLTYLSIMLIPSALFWSSGITKESVAHGLSFLLISLCIELWYGSQKSRFNLGLVIICLFCLVQLKFYLAGVLIVSLFSFIILKLLNGWNWRSVSSFIALATFGLLLMEWLHPWMRISRLPLTVFENYELISNGSDPGHYVLLDLEPTYQSMILNTPRALVGGFFRPFIWEHFEWTSLLFRLENLVILVLTIWSLSNWKKIKLNPEVSASLIFCCVLSVFLTLSSPNFGTLLRYTSVFQPILFLLTAVVPYNSLVKQKTE